MENYNHQNNVIRFAQLAVRVWGCQMDFNNPEKTALAGIDRLEEFLHGIGMPLSFKELGAKEEDIPTLVKALCYGDGREGTITGFVTLDEEDCTKIYQMMIGK